MRGGRGWHGMLEAEEEEYQRKVSDRVLFIRMMRYIFNYRRRSGILVLAIFASTLINLAPPLMFTLAIDRYITSLDVGGLTLLSVAFLAVYASFFVVDYAERFIINWLGSRMEFDMRIDLFRQLQRLDLSYYANREVGSITSRVTNDIDKITELVTSGLASVMADLMTLVGIIAVMLWMQTWLSLITFTIIPMMAGFMYLWGKRVRKVYRETRKTIASVSAKMEESVSGMKEIQAYSREKETRREFQQVNVSNMQANIQAGQVMSAFWPAVSVFTSIGNFLVLWFGGSAVMNGTLTVGVLFGFMSYLNRFFWPIQDLSMFWNNVQSAFAAAERVFRILDTEVEIKDKENALELPTLHGRISYEKVSFSYEAHQPVLVDIDLLIMPNTTVALVGLTGVGKTTLMNLLYRFYEPQKGRIVVDDHDLQDVKIESLRRQMAIVLQDTYLFSGTVLDNIRYGRTDATSEEVETVAKAVGAHEFIINLPEGYETEVQERGSRLSVGQRQLISLARALLADPRILIMDEATSSVDAYTELLIKQAMKKILKDRTSIIIAHRISTVRNADKIVVLDKGRIVEMGNHDELIEKGGLYSQLYEIQFKSDTD